MDIEQLFIRVCTVKRYSTYGSSNVHYNIDISDMTCSKGYQKALIRLPKDLDYSKKILTDIAKYFKNATKVVMYERENFNYYFLDVYYIDRQLKNDYLTAKTDMVFFRGSGKRMKDIKCYNPNNDNHFYVQAGERIPTMVNGEPKYFKVKKWSSRLTNNKRDFLNKNNERKNLISKYLNDLLRLVKPNKALVTAKQWGKFGLEFMGRIEAQIIGTHKNYTKAELMPTIRKYQYKAKLNNRKKMQSITAQMI
jgi:hypothetical protein